MGHDTQLWLVPTGLSIPLRATPIPKTITLQDPQGPRTSNINIFTVAKTSEGSILTSLPPNSVPNCEPKIGPRGLCTFSIFDGFKKAMRYSSNITNGPW